ncbi:hypothetical protein N7V53_22345, partial [Kosakonia sp. HypNH10]|uniref:hypothetical protein n=1 Tax=Kosakonia sp. HypNH10 TaxID=2980101 RepID=UPI00244B1E9C
TVQKSAACRRFFIFCAASFFGRICSKNIKKTKEFAGVVDNNYDGDEAAGAYRNINFSLKDNYHGCYQY